MDTATLLPRLLLPPPHETPEETLVADSRAGLSPAQMVERKLLSLLKTNPLAVSHLMTDGRNARKPA